MFRYLAHGEIANSAAGGDGVANLTPLRNGPYLLGEIARAARSNCVSRMKCRCCPARHRRTKRTCLFCPVRQLGSFPNRARSMGKSWDGHSPLTPPPGINVVSRSPLTGFRPSSKSSGGDQKQEHCCCCSQTQTQRKRESGREKASCLENPEPFAQRPQKDKEEKGKQKHDERHERDRETGLSNGLLTRPSASPPPAA